MHLVTSVRATLMRTALPLVVFVVILLLPEYIGDHALLRVAPWFVGLIMLQMAPAMLSSRPDLFEPPVYNGLVGAFSTLSTLLSFFVAGHLKMETLQVGDPDQVADLAVKACLAMIIGTLGYYLGYYPRVAIFLRRFFPDLTRIRWTPRRIFLVSLIPAAAFVVAYTVFQSRVGVSLFDITELSRGKATWRQDPTLSWMLRGVELGLIPVLLYFTWAAGQRGWRHLIVAAVLCAIVAALVLRLGQRGPMAFGLLIAVVVFHYLKKRIPIMVFLVVYFIGLVASNVMYHWRVDDPETPRTEAVSQIVDNPVQVLTTHEKERQRFAILAMVIGEFPDTYDYLLGESWTPMLLSVVPRWILPEKTDAYEWQDNRIVYRISGIPAPTPYVAVLYANLSWVGILIGTLFLGLVHRALYEWRRRGDNNPGVALMYALIMIFFTPSTMGISAMLQYVVPVWVLIRLMGRTVLPGYQPTSAPSVATTRS